MTELLIRGVTAITMADPLVRSDVSLAIDGGQIVGIHAAGEEPEPASCKRIIDGRGRLAIPGLINAHTHLAMVLMRGYADDLPLETWLRDEIWPLEAQLTDEDVYWASLLAMAELIRSGTTCFADMYFHMDQVARATEESGMRGLLGYGMIAPEPGAKVEQELERTRRFTEEVQARGNGRIRAAVAPHAPYTCDKSLWHGAVNLALELDLPLHTHLCETAHEIEQARATWGVSPIEYLDELGVFAAPVFAAHGVHVSEDDIECLAERGVAIVHNPTSNLKLASGFAPVPALLEAGVTVAIGTDGAASNNNLDLLEESRLAALIQKGILSDATALGALETLKLATVHGSSALRWEEIGSLEVGKRADIALLGLDGPHWTPTYDPISNLIYSASAADVETVIIEGAIVMEGREIRTFDEAEAKARVAAFAQRHPRR